MALDDANPAHRAKGCEYNQHFFVRRTFDVLFLFGDRVSNGMKDEIEAAYFLGIPIVARSSETHKWLIEFLHEKK